MLNTLYLTISLNCIPWSRRKNMTVKMTSYLVEFFFIMQGSNTNRSNWFFGILAYRRSWSTQFPVLVSSPESPQALQTTRSGLRTRWWHCFAPWCWFFPPAIPPVITSQEARLRSAVQETRPGMYHLFIQYMWFLWFFFPSMNQSWDFIKIVVYRFKHEN